MDGCWGSRRRARDIREAFGAACLKTARTFPLSKLVRPMTGWQAWTVRACMADRWTAEDAPNMTRLILLNSVAIEQATMAYESLWETGMAGMCDAQVFELQPDPLEGFKQLMDSRALELARLRGVALVLFREKYRSSVEAESLTKLQLKLWGASHV